MITAAPSARLTEARREEMLHWLTECKRLQQAVAVYQFKDYLDNENQYRYAFAIYLQDKDPDKNMSAVGTFDYLEERNLVKADFSFREQTEKADNAKEDIFYQNGKEPSASRLLWFSAEREHDFDKPLELQLTLNSNLVAVK